MPYCVDAPTPFRAYLQNNEDLYTYRARKAEHEARQDAEQVEREARKKADYEQGRRDAEAAKAPREDKVDAARRALHDSRLRP